MVPLPTLVPLHPTRALKARLSLQHILAGILLAATGLSELRGPEPLHGWHWFLAWAATLSGSALLVAIMNELRTYDHRHRPRIAWVEVLAGVMLIVEGLEKLKFTKLVQPALGYFAIGAWTLALGLRLVRAGGVRTLRLDARGLVARLSPFRVVAALWSELVSVDEQGDAVVFTPRRGDAKRLPLGGVANRAEVVAAIRGYAARFIVPPPPQHEETSR